MMLSGYFDLSAQVNRIGLSRLWRDDPNFCEVLKGI